MSYDTTDFNKDVIERSHEIPVLVDFWAEWCGPCRMLGPVLERLADKNKGKWELVKLNTEVFQDVAAQYGIRSIPNVKLFVDGKVDNEFVGALPEQQIVQWLDKALPSQHRKQLQQAKELIASQDAGKAQPLLHEIVAAEPDNHEAKVLLAKSYLYADPQKARELVEGIEEDSEHFEEAASVRTLSRLFDLAEHPEKLADQLGKEPYLKGIKALHAEDFAAALDHFIEVIMVNREYDDDGARKACISIFKHLGEDHPVTKDKRTSFSRALF